MIAVVVAVAVVVAIVVAVAVILEGFGIKSYYASSIMILLGEC